MIAPMPASTPPRSRHRELLIIAAYVAIVLCAGALFAPVLFAGGKWLLQIAESRGWDQSRALGWFVHALRNTEFPGYFDRAALIAALLLLWPLLRLLRVSWREVTGGSKKGALREGGISFLLAISLLAAMAFAIIQIGVCKLGRNPDWFSLGKPLMTGLAVGIIEEFLFRGAMLGILRRSFGDRGAVFWTTFFFAMLHFLKPPAHGSMPDESVHWWSGFAIIPQLFRGFGDSGEFVAEFLLLASVGWMLARARLATDALWASIGLHAGWVAGMKYLGQIASTTPALRARDFAPWFAENHCKAIVSPVVGLVPLITVLITGFIAVRICNKQSRG